MEEKQNQEAVRRQLLALANLDKTELRGKWLDLYGHNPPNYGTTFMRKRLAYRIQELFYGGISDTLKARLLAAREKPTQAKNLMGLTPGTTLVKIWHNQKYKIAVLPKGFEFNGQVYRSLSAIALKITGTHWNAKRFFQIKDENEKQD